MSQINTDKIASNSGGTTALTIADNGGVTAASILTSPTITSTNINTDTIKSNAGSTTALTISDSGYVNKPAQPCGMWQAFSQATTTFSNNVDINPWSGSLYNAYEQGITYTGSGRFTVPITGKYLITWQFYKNNTDAGRRIAVMKNGSTYYAYSHDGTSVAGTQGLTGSTIINFAANDYFSFRNISGSNIALAMYNNHCTISAALIA